MNGAVMLLEFANISTIARTWGSGLLWVELNIYKLSQDLSSNGHHASLTERSSDTKDVFFVLLTKNMASQS